MLVYGLKYSHRMTRSDPTILRHDREDKQKRTPVVFTTKHRETHHDTQVLKNRSSWTKLQQAWMAREDNSRSFKSYLSEKK